MEAKELRIGNLLEKGGEIFIADFITIQMAHNYTPIPLTEEWLLKFGFEKSTDYEYYLKAIEYTENGFFSNREKKIELFAFFEDGLTISLDNTRTESEGNLECINICLKHIQYVHQLQNLYFALTNEELTIK